MNKGMSKGNFGTKKAKEWFDKNGWTMFKVEPEMRIVKASPRGFECVFVGDKGLPDFLGMNPSSTFCAVEVKAASRGWVRFPCSWVKKHQRKFIEKCSFPVYIGIVWDDSTVELFEYKSKGSYAKGGGATSTLIGC